MGTTTNTTAFQGALDQIMNPLEVSVRLAFYTDEGIAYGRKEWQEDTIALYLRLLLKENTEAKQIVATWTAEGFSNSLTVKRGSNG